MCYRKVYKVTDCGDIRECTGECSTTTTSTTIDLSHVDCSKCDLSRGEICRPDVNDCHRLDILYIVYYKCILSIDTNV